MDYDSPTIAEEVKSFKFLGVHITEDLSWTFITICLAKKAQQHLDFQRRMNRTNFLLPSLPPSTKNRECTDQLSHSLALIPPSKNTASTRSPAFSWTLLPPGKKSIGRYIYATTTRGSQNTQHIAASQHLVNTHDCITITAHLNFILDT